MIERETLREFSVSIITKQNHKFIIQYGYDLSKSGYDYYVRASIDGKAFNSDKATLNKVRKLNIQSINDLIELIGCDETGVRDQSAMHSNVIRLDSLMKLKSTIKSLRELYYNGIYIGKEHSVVRFEGYLRYVHYPQYYKRDMDLIRASKNRIMKTK